MAARPTKLISLFDVALQVPSTSGEAPKTRYRAASSFLVSAAVRDEDPPARPRNVNELVAVRTPQNVPNLEPRTVSSSRHRSAFKNATSLPEVQPQEQSKGAAPRQPIRFYLDTAALLPSYRKPSLTIARYFSVVENFGGAAVEYKGFVVEAFEREQGKWRAIIRRSNWQP